MTNDTNLLQRERLDLLLDKIEFPKVYTEKVLAEFDKWVACEAYTRDEETISHARKALDSKDIYGSQDGALMLLLHIATEERDHGLWERYPEDIFVDTMSAFTLYVEFYREATGEYGYGKATWPLLLVNAKKFRIGALEYELFEESGTREIRMHIPSGTNLAPDNINNSIAGEKIFMKKYFPEWAELPHCCESWMLSPVLKDMLPESSKIRWFGTLFDVVEFLPDEKWFLEFIFKLEYFQWINEIDYNTLREDTSLQRAMKKFVLAGGKPGAALGYLKLNIWEV
jgi:hypothetical protein